VLELQSFDLVAKQYNALLERGSTFQFFLVLKIEAFYFACHQYNLI
jgi:hypothetical protein